MIRDIVYRRRPIDVQQIDKRFDFGNSVFIGNKIIFQGARLFFRKIFRHGGIGNDQIYGKSFFRFQCYEGMDVVRVGYRNLVFTQNFYHVVDFDLYVSLRYIQDLHLPMKMVCNVVLVVGRGQHRKIVYVSRVFKQFLGYSFHDFIINTKF